MSTSQQVLLGYGSSGFVIPRSLRFRASASAYLTRTVASTSDRQKATWSGWVKKGQLAITAGLFASDDGTGSRDFIRINGNDKLNVSLNENTVANLITTQVFRDPSAWYHFIVAIDTTQATAANRIKLYVNGVQITVFDTATYPSQNANFVAWNVSGKVQDVGDSSPPGAGQFFDGYMAEVNWIDGQQLTPTSFGATSTTTGVWSPIQYGGSYGTNGYYLTFNSYATTAALGTDTSGNSNTFTVNNCSVTAGVTYDSMIDVPTVTATGSNYAVMNPLFAPTSGSNVITNGNLLVTGGSAGANNRARSTFSIASGKYYWEVSIPTTGSGSGDQDYGVIITASSNTGIGTSSAETNYGSSGNVYKNGSPWSYGTAVTWTIGDVMGCAYDFSAGTVAFYKNNTLVTTVTGLDSSPRQPYCTLYDTSDAMNFNFGQRPFTYTPPSGYSALNTYNLAAPSILIGNLYMDATTYTGTGASQSITSLAMQPDFTWLKARSSAENHRLFDSVRGVGNSLISNATNAEASGTDGVSAFNSNGFTLGTNSGNTNAVTYVSWNWKGGGAAVSNTSGSITSSVSANTTSGCSIVTYTGTGANATVGHGLGVAPSMVITKGRDAVPNNWGTWHTSLGALGYLYLNNTTAAGSLSTFWNSAVPTSSVFSLGSETTVNTNTKTYVAYCFAQIAGYSAFGSYTGNNLADGPFAYLGFRARWIMLKQSSAGVTSWWILDTATGTYNVMSLGLAANDSSAESSGNAWMDITANGFKIRQSGGGANASGQTYIYAAFAENPFNNSLAR